MPAHKPKPIVLPVVIGDAGMVFSLDEHANARLRAQFVAAVKSWPHGPAELELRPIEDTRSGRANAYLWAVVYHLIALEMYGRATKSVKDDLHEIMKLRHNPKVIVNPLTGEEITIGGSTKHLPMEPFGHYIEAVMLDGAEAFGIVFPEPRESEEWRESKPAALRKVG